MEFPSRWNHRLAESGTTRRTRTYRISNTWFTITRSTYRRHLRCFASRRHRDRINRLLGPKVVKHLQGANDADKNPGAADYEQAVHFKSEHVRDDLVGRGLGGNREDYRSHNVL